MLLTDLLNNALEARAPLLDADHTSACRLFHGFLEGDPSLSIDCYGRTLVVHDYSKSADNPALPHAIGHLTARLPWLRSVLVKPRHHPDPDRRQGTLWPDSAPPDRKIREHGVWYAIDPFLNRDAGLYLDTRLLRRHLLDTMAGRELLNTFAYTGSLGIAALAGGATRVVQLDRNRAFLNVAKTSCTLNGFPVVKGDYLSADFWPRVAHLNRSAARFDTVVIDPPFFAATRSGTVDLARNTARLINKVRPLVRNGGQIIAINNALFVSGADYLHALESVCTDGWVTLSGFVSVDVDFTGTPATRHGTPVTDPAPFNHTTKIAILTIHHK
jgi:23S rRNA (cytosine1962-C5)-methyltransferase